MRSLLLPIAWLYGAVVWLRNFCYDAGLLRTIRAGVPVISVGNISVGGTGKTPFVELLIRYLLDRKRRVAVLTRGYGRHGDSAIVLKGSASGALTFRETGDEPLQIARRFPDVPVMIDARRIRSAQRAVAEEGADVLVMDDGFQHRSLHRDLDIVLIDDSVPSWTHRMLPSGMLREPLSGLKRADVIIHTRGNDFVRRMPDGAGAGTTVEARMQIRAGRVYRLRNGESVLLDGRNVCTFCGIGNPGSFRNTVLSLGGQITDALVFPDHHPYDTNDIDSIVRAYRNSSADWIVTTEKDAIRIEGTTLSRKLLEVPVCVVTIEAVLAEGGESVMKEVDRVLGKS
jgi:tetraacyldisaccharide 4'-kinase